MRFALSRDDDELRKSKSQVHISKGTRNINLCLLSDLLCTRARKNYLSIIQYPSYNSAIDRTKRGCFLYQTIDIVEKKHTKKIVINY